MSGEVEVGEYGPMQNVRPKRGTFTRHWAQCPSCGSWGTIDDEQYRGEVSVDCQECDYHETHDHRDE